MIIFFLILSSKTTDGDIFGRNFKSRTNINEKLSKIINNDSGIDQIYPN